MLAMQLTVGRIVRTDDIDGAARKMSLQQGAQIKSVQAAGVAVVTECKDAIGSLWLSNGARLEDVRLRNGPRVGSSFYVSKVDERNSQLFLRVTKKVPDKNSQKGAGMGTNRGSSGV